MGGTSNSEENPDLGYQPSPLRSDQRLHSPSTETTRHSIASADSFAYCRTNSEASAAFSEPPEDSISFSDIASPQCWQGLKSPARAAFSKLATRHHKHGMDDEVMDLELMKERFSKLLLGEDMSGSGKGVATAVCISNAITNLYVSVFGQSQRLEPLHTEKKQVWKREMNCLLSVCDYMVEFSPTLETLKDGTSFEVMTSRPRSDISINLPALRKLDAMLLGILDSFQETEFWYAERGSVSGSTSRSGGSSSRSGSFRGVVGQPRSQPAHEKWWLPVPCMAPNGLSEKSKKHLRRKRDCAYQIHKAAMAINGGILDEMHIPESYIASLPKCGRTSVGDAIYRHMYSSEKFSPDRLLDSLEITSEHNALDLADRVETSMHTWRRKLCIADSKSSWAAVKSLVSDIGMLDKNHVLAERAEALLACLKQRYPELSQTTLDTSKIQYNKDVGQAVLESYSRVLEGLAFNIVAWIDDVLFVDKATTTNQ